MSFVVTRRTREIGIRIALGAAPSSTTWLFVRETAAMLLVGIAIAVTIVSAVGRLVESELFGVKPLDGLTIACAALLVVVVDPMFAAIRNSAEYGELIGAARACRTRFRDHVRARTRTP